VTTNSSELDFRRRWYRAHVDRYEADPERVEKSIAAQRWFDDSAAEALVLRDTLARDGDIDAFKDGLQKWAVKPGTLAFNGFSGQMLVNQLVKRAGDDAGALSRLFPAVLSAPRDDADARSKLQAMVDYIESVRVGAHPAPGHSPFLLSYFWGLEDHARWPVMWSSAVSFLEFSTGTPLPPTPAERYLRYLELVRELGDEHDRFERVVAWWDTSRPVFLDPVLVDRCAFGLDTENVDSDALAANAAVLVSVANHIATQLASDLSTASGRSLTPKKPAKLWKPERPRSDLWADWWARDDWALGLRLWVNQNGASLGVMPGQVRAGWYDEAASIVSAASLPGYRILGARGSKAGEDVGHVGGRSGEFTYALWFTPDQLAELDVRSAMVDVAVATQPVIDELLHRATGVAPSTAPDPLEPIVEEFLAARGYPTPADEEHKADRSRFASLLADGAVAMADPAELRRIWNTQRYGGPGPQSILNTSLRDADAAEYDRILDAINFVCWGGGDDATRIDAVLGGGQYSVRGLGESVILKLLSICHPERYVPVFPYSGPLGKRQMLKLLEIPEPKGDSRGQLQVAANDLIRERLDRLFPGDPWGLAQFLYWYLNRDPGGVIVDQVDPMEELAEALLVDRAFLDDIVALLEDKGQVILYGPPGTGKTYLARRLAETLVPDPTRRSLVQFHPSTSYEDFFEGYRPETTIDGEMTYRITPGPLALLAERAASAPGKRHVMIIDEINRANLPKVFGELLFLLEYRDEQVRTLYRPDDAFELPKDIWFIGTMNTADRSIALVDAALRRRFNFIPFFPNHGPMKGLLERWLAAQGEPPWVGELVAMVNDELEQELGGPHLQLGPSHFMRRHLDEDALRRIWLYNIEPFIEDQFFGDPAQIERFRFESVYKRYTADSGLDEIAAIALASGNDAGATGADE
jgi:5-methylcytosine-specific restriction protein B